MEVPFPSLGLYESKSTEKQPVGTSPSLQNVRPTDVNEERVGGQRPAVVAAYDDAIVADHPVLYMVEISTTYITPVA